MEEIKKVAVIGAGNMGAAIAGGLLRHSGADVCVANRGKERLDRFSEDYRDYSDRLFLTRDFAAGVEDADLVVIAVKPWAFEEVCNAIAQFMKPSATVISVAAGKGLAAIGDCFGDCRRRMYMIPNTAVRIGKGIAFAAEEGIGENTLSEIKALFAPITKLEIIDEGKMPAAMALCSCGIAYAYKMIAAAAQAGVELGFGYDAAARYFAATMEGAAAMVEATGKDPQTLINEVTTPGGITIKGVNTLDREGFPAAVIDAILNSAKK